MAWIKTVPPGEATGLLADLYAQNKGARQRVSPTATVFSLKPHTLQGLELIRADMRRGNWKLSPVRREMLAMVTSALNRCRF